MREIRRQEMDWFRLTFAGGVYMQAMGYVVRVCGVRE